MAFIAFERERLSHLYLAVFDAVVATEAVNSVLSDMDSMKCIWILLCSQSLDMTLVTLAVSHVTASFGNGSVAG